MGRVNRFYWEGETVYFATMHGKEEILRPILSRAGLLCERAEIDTDQFGTFSGEIERQGGVRETLRRKLSAAAARVPHGRLFLASEGSFLPHPLHGLFATDLESLLLWDKQQGLEIYAEFLSHDVSHAEVLLAADDHLQSFLSKIDFPNHAVIVRPEGLFEPIFKGLSDERSIREAMQVAALRSKTNKVILITDLRANHNAKRRLAIARAGERLLENILSLCPDCHIPGFSITRGVPGLPCVECGEPSQAAKSVQYQCIKCGFAEERPRPDGKTSIQPEDCAHCNP